MGLDFLYRDLSRVDAPAVHALGISEVAFRVDPNVPGFWTVDQLEHWFNETRNGVCIGAFTPGDRLVGFALARLHHFTGKADWENLFVLPAYRGKAIGLQLAVLLQQKLRERGATYICLAVSPTNAGMLALARHLNLHDCGEMRWLGARLKAPAITI